MAVLFGGKGKLSSVMGDFAKGIKSFKAGMKDEDAVAAEPPPQVTPPAVAPTIAAGERPAHDRT